MIKLKAIYECIIFAILNNILCWFSSSNPHTDSVAIFSTLLFVFMFCLVEFKLYVYLDFEIKYFN